MHPINITEIKLIKQTITESLIKLFLSRLHLANEILKPDVLPFLLYINNVNIDEKIVLLIIS